MLADFGKQFSDLRQSLGNLQENLEEIPRFVKFSQKIRNFTNSIILL